MGPYEEKYTLFSDDEPTGWVDLGADGEGGKVAEVGHDGARRWGYDSDEGWGPGYSDVTE
jgi:hypothetical protein